MVRNKIKDFVKDIAPAKSFRKKLNIFLDNPFFSNDKIHVPLSAVM